MIDVKKEAFLVGQIVGAINELKPAAKIVEEMVSDCIKILTSLPGVTVKSRL